MMPRPLECIIIFYLFLSCGVFSLAWQLSSSHTTCNDSRTVYWLTAKNESTTVHFLLAADVHVRPPAIIVLHSYYMDSTVTVDCKAYVNNATFPNSIKVDAVTASYGLLLYELCTYIDLEDRAQIPPNTDCHQYFGSNLDWELKQVDHDGIGEASIAFRGTTLNDSRDMFIEGGSVEIKFTVYDKDTKPHNTFYYEVAGGLCVEVQIAIDRLLAKNPRTRVAPIIMVFSNQSMEDDDDFVQLDDYSNTFSDGPLGKLKSQYLLLDQRVKAGRVGHDAPPAFLQSIPVSVTSADPDVTSHSLRLASLGPRTQVKHTSTAKKYAHSLVYAYYGSRFNQVHQGSHEGHVGAREQFINLGTPKDGFYVATNYSAWTVLIHLGTPDVQPPEAQSRVAVGAAVTVGFLLAAVGTGVAYRYRRRRLTDQLVHRIEPGFEEPAPVRERMEPVEPFQRRKLCWDFQRRRPGGTSTEPLLHVDPPPSYDSVSTTAA